MDPQTTTSPRRRAPDSGLPHWMNRVVEECHRAAEDLAPDPVHDLRVALRRCRSMADGLMVIDPDSAWKDMKKAGKSLFQSLGELRDVQVMTEWVQKLGPPGDPETAALLNLLGRREAEQKILASEAIRAFDLHQWRKWTRELPRRAARVRRGSIVFQHLALERWTAAYNLHRRAMRTRSQTALHQLRIGLKRFRYIVENFLPQLHEAWSSDLKELQDLLGDVHDLDVLWATATQVNAFESEDSRQRWQQVVQQAREKRVERYRERMVGPASLWRIWRVGLPQKEHVREAATARLKVWASFLDPDFAHSERVATFAEQTLNGLISLGLSPCNSDRDLHSILEVAAVAHDVGRAHQDKGHHKRSYRWIGGLTPPLGWAKPELDVVAAVARFHRGPLPKPRHKAMRALSVEDQKIVSLLAGVLRLAQTFDRGHSETTPKLRVEEKGGTLTVSVSGYRPWTPDAEQTSAARHLLELVLRRAILVKGLRQTAPPRRRPRPTLVRPVPVA